jgi:hypothetical protein
MTTGPSWDKIRLKICFPKFEPEILTLDISELRQSSANICYDSLRGHRSIADYRHGRLLRAYRVRPRDNSPCKNPNEFPPQHLSVPRTTEICSVALLEVVEGAGHVNARSPSWVIRVELNTRPLLPLILGKQNTKRLPARLKRATTELCTAAITSFIQSPRRRGRAARVEW